MLPDLESPRLLLTPVHPKDLGLFHSLNADELVMRHITGHAASGEETNAEWSQRLGERSDVARGLGYWTGWYDGAFAGWWGLGACSWDQNTANLGYRLTPPYWGRGLATEGCHALLLHAFTAVGLHSVWASTTEANGASQRVLAKLAMHYLGIEYNQCQYKVTATDWFQATGG